MTHLTVHDLHQHKASSSPITVKVNTKDTAVTQSMQAKQRNQYSTLDPPTDVNIKVIATGIKPENDSMNNTDFRPSKELTHSKYSAEADQQSIETKD